MTKAMLGAENTSSPSNTAPWSPKLKEAYTEVRRINRAIRSLIPARVTHLQSRYKSGKQELESLCKERHQAIRALQQIRMDAYNHRQTYLEEAADIQELKGNTDRVQILRNIRTVEELRRTYGHIRYATKEANQINGLTRVSYPTKTGWKTTTDTTDLENRVLSQLTTHFGQASNTPLAENGDIYKILDGSDINTHGLPDTERGLKKWFNNTQTPQIATLITDQEFRQGIKRWKERTSTSPSGRHLGHYHAQILPRMGEESENVTTTFVNIHVTILNLATKQKIVLPRWKEVNTICLPKDTGTPKIHRLRPLNLYEADLNLLLRIILAKRLLRKAERENTLPDEAWGNRKLRSAGDVGLQKNHYNGIGRAHQGTARTNRSRRQSVL